MDYSGLQTRVQRLVIDLPSAVQTEVPIVINEVIRELQTDHNFKVMEKLVSAQQTTLSTRNLVAVPANFKEYRGEPYILSDLGSIQRVYTSADRKEVQHIFADDDTGAPMFLVEAEPTDDLGTRQWEVWPLPDGLSDYANGEYRVYIPYWGYLSTLANNGDQNWFTNNGEEYIIHAAAARCFALDWDAEHEAAMLSKAAIYKKHIMDRDKKMRLSSIGTLVPHKGVYAPMVRR